MKNDIIALANKSMPAVFCNAELTYNAAKNILLTQGYTSQAGNTYFQGVRFSDRIVITQQIGRGYCYIFLNGLKIYGYNGTEMTLIGERSYDTCYYNDAFVQKESEGIIREFLKNQAILSNSYMEKTTIEKFSKQLVLETMKNKLPSQQLDK
jgi:hypothetical protein